MTLLAFDVETTGLNVEEGDRIIEIGLVELDTHLMELTGREFHQYLNPERWITEDALTVHGLDNDFLQDKPKFSEISQELHDFIGDCRLIAHNAKFDLGFLNQEFKRVKLPIIPSKNVLDSLEIARRELPHLSRFSLDALCRHFELDLSLRQKHGALVDAMLLAEVYFRMLGGGRDLFESSENDDQKGGSTLSHNDQAVAKKRPSPLPSLLTAEEKEMHQEKMKELGEKVLWSQYL